MEMNGVLWVTLTIAAVLFGLRLFPFVASARLRDSGYFLFLSQNMPIGVTLLLVSYTLQGVSVWTPPYGIPEVSAPLVCVVLYVLWRQALVAILVSLALCLWLSNSTVVATVFGFTAV